MTSKFPDWVSGWFRRYFWHSTTMMISKIETTMVAAAEQVAGNTDLLEEILIHLPSKSLTRSKLVSKQWLSLISDAQFVRRHSQHSHTRRKFHTGMFVTDYYRNCRFADFVSFTDELNPTHQTIPSLGFLYDGIEPPFSHIEIINSCNGLVLCAVSWIFLPFDYCVCNPTTKTFRMLGITRKPEASYSPKDFAFLAFDPSVSLHYKVICPRITKRFEYDDTLYLYSSEDQSWNTIVCPYYLSPSPKGFFLNGSIYLRLYGERIYLCFDVYNEVMKPIVLPPMTNYLRTFLDAFGSHLYVPPHENKTPDFRVCEMSCDLSQWVTKYNASVGPLLYAFPRISLLRRGQVSYLFKGITLVEGAKQHESQLVLAIPGKLLLYNLKDKTAKELYSLRGELDGQYRYRCVEAFQFIETLSVV